MERLLDMARTAGFTVEFTDIGKFSGLTMPGHVVLINSARSGITQRTALAHELGHIHYHHDWRCPHDRQRDETLADQFAADLLIDPHEYAIAEVMYGNTIAIAHELEVPVRLINIWQTSRIHSPVRL